MLPLPMLLLMPILCHHPALAVDGLIKRCTPDKERVGSECCTQCGVGFGMISKCYRDQDGVFHDTNCQQCSERNIMTFSSAVSAVLNCEKCRPCNHPVEAVESECTLTRDTVCKCVPGYYRRQTGPAECVPCASCQPGEGLSPVCNGSRDSDCAACPAGQFSAYSLRLGNRLCRPCPTGCPPGYELTSPCQPGADAVCRKAATGQLFNSTELLQTEAARKEGAGRQKEPSRRPSDWKDLIDNGNSRPYNPQRFNVSQVTRTEEPVGRHSVSRNDMIPVYCAVLGAVIASLIVWIVFKYFRRRVQDGKTQQQGPAGGALIPPRSPVYPPQGCQPTALVKRKSVDSGFGGSEAFASVNSSTRPLKEISDSRFQRLENILSNNPNPNGWKDLAAELGFQGEEVQEFEERADVVRQSPIRLMLKSWSERSGSTVGALSRCLQKVGRKDALILFKESERHHHHHQGRHRGLQMQQRQVPEETSMQEMCQV